MALLPNELNYNLTAQEQVNALAKAFWAIVDFYGFNQDVLAKFLYVSQNNRSPIKTYKENREFPNKPLVAMENTAQLLGIHKNLSIIFPEADNNRDNQSLKQGWFNVPMNIYGGKSPSQFLQDGDNNEILERLKVIRRNLDLQRIGK